MNQSPAIFRDSAVVAGLEKGDKPGHEFHGNQYTAAAGAADKASDEAYHKGEEANRRDQESGSKDRHTETYKAHIAAAAAQRAAAKLAPNSRTASQHRLEAHNHDSAAMEHINLSIGAKK